MPAPVTEANLNDSVMQHMRRDFTRLRLNQTVGEALAEMRQNPPQGRIVYFYVVDDAGRLQGVVPTRRLLLSPLGQPIGEVMIRQVVALPAGATVLDACEFFTLHRLLGFPVVDDDRVLIGVVDVELYTDELSELGRADEGDALFQLIGVHVAQARITSPLAAFRIRFPWLACNLGGGILAAFLSWFYEKELQAVVALALFIPVVLAMAESVSIQSVSLALDAIHGGKPTWRGLFPKLRREAGTGFLLGCAGGLVVAVVALVWIGKWTVALSLLGGIAGGVVCAAVLGLSVPNVLHMLRRDPQVAAGPISLAASDVATLLLYFNLARLLV